MFTAIELENFRGFGKLELHDLGGVNLVVGKNNTGKTTCSKPSRSLQTRT